MAARSATVFCTLRRAEHINRLLLHILGTLGRHHDNSGRTVYLWVADTSTTSQVVQTLIEGDGEAM